MAKNDDDDVSNNSGNPTFQEVVDARVSRRSFLGGGLAAAAALSLTGVDALLRAVPASGKTKGPLLGFQNIPISTGDAVTVPPGYTGDGQITVNLPASTSKVRLLPTRSASLASSRRKLPRLPL